MTLPMSEEPLLEGDYPEVQPFKEARQRRKPARQSPVKDAATDTAAKTAAGLLSKLNLLVALSFNGVMRMPDTAGEIMKANEQFEEMAYEALLNDPLLCKKIMSTGASSGKLGLTIAYASMGVAILPAAKAEIENKREARKAKETDE